MQTLGTETCDTACRPRVVLLTDKDPSHLTAPLEAWAQELDVRVASELPLPGADEIHVIAADEGSAGWKGVQTIRRLRSLAGEPSVIVLLTEASEETVIAYRSAGAADCVRHDRPERLAAAIREALDRRPRRVPSCAGSSAAEILDRMSDGFFALDPDWRFTYLNRKAKRILGGDVRALAGKEIWQEFPALAGSLVERQFFKAMRTQVPLEFDSQGKTWNVPAHFRVYPSEEGLAVYFEEVPATGHAGDQVRHANRMESLGMLTSGVAHDFNNLLTIIGGYTQMAVDSTAAGDPLHQHLEAVLEAADRASLLTRQLLAFSRRQSAQARVLDLNRLVSKLTALAERLIGEDVELCIDLAPAPLRIRADAGQMEQVILNLLVNARDAMPKGGRVRLETAQTAVSENENSPAGLAPGSYVTFSVADTGAGMTAEVRARIFEPFFTTKAAGCGTGLGLSMVKSMVGQAGGVVMVDSEPGRGSTFRIYLPRAEQRIPARAEAASPRGSHRGNETILLVEDAPEVRRTVRCMLQRQGYHVLQARSGKEALCVWRRHRKSIDLLITDVVMPRMSGSQLAAQLLRLQPGLKILYMSGYTVDKISTHGVADTEVSFIEKPFTPDSLSHKVREALDSGNREEEPAGQLAESARG